MLTDQDFLQHLVTQPAQGKHTGLGAKDCTASQQRAAKNAVYSRQKEGVVGWVGGETADNGHTAGHKHKTGLRRGTKLAMEGRKK